MNSKDDPESRNPIAREAFLRALGFRSFGQASIVLLVARCTLSKLARRGAEGAEEALRLARRNARRGDRRDDREEAGERVYTKPLEFALCPLPRPVKPVLAPWLVARRAS